MKILVIGIGNIIYNLFILNFFIFLLKLTLKNSYFNVAIYLGIKLSSQKNYNTECLAFLHTYGKFLAIYTHLGSTSTLVKQSCRHQTPRGGIFTSWTESS